MAEAHAPGTVDVRPRQRQVRRQPPSADAAGFPGCKPVPMTAADLVADDGPRIEYWDAADGFAWLIDAPCFQHEFRRHRMPALLGTVSLTRGADIVCGGATSFYERGLGGELIRAMAGDQAVFLDADRAWALRPEPTVLGDEPVPDVMLEVDHTTDVRRRKLGEYEKWRFPEVWVEVPDTPHCSRPSRPSALTIHLLDGETGRYAEAAASRALAGWTAAEIHLALNERQRSAATWRALQRVGRALGERGGTKPAEDPIMRGLLEEARRAGREAGLVAGRNEEVLTIVLEVLTQRNIPHSPTLSPDRMTGHSMQRLMDAALACGSEADFLARLDARHE